jgi:hypothetical protein
VILFFPNIKHWFPIKRKVLRVPRVLSGNYLSSSLPRRAPPNKTILLLSYSVSTKSVCIATNSKEWIHENSK